MELIQCELNRIIINETSDHQQIFLKEKNAENPRSLQIYIGMYEAWTINNTIKDIHSPRPLTHDLIVNLLEGMKATLTRVVLTRLEEGTYYAVMEVQKDGTTYDIDARPSDAIAVSLKTSSPIFVSKEVMDEAAL